jgi:hypothetical protein
MITSNVVLYGAIAGEALSRRCRRALLRAQLAQR